MKKNIIFSAITLILTISGSAHGAARSETEAFDASPMFYFSPGTENKTLFWHAERGTSATSELIFKAALVDSFHKTPIWADSRAHYDSTLAERPNAPRVILENNALTVTQPHGTMQTLASLFVKNGSDEKSLHPHGSIRRFILLANSQSKDTFDGMVYRLNNLAFSWTAKDIAQEFTRTCGEDHAFALIDLTQYLQMYHGPDWQKTLPISRYKGTLYAQDDIEKTERTRLMFKVGALGAVLGAAGLALLKKRATE